jgi:signal-transduction protein with cAMP-binding, CBS, and nucleotidyltransferase domain
VIDSFPRLKERAGELGNHHRKYLHHIATHKDLLIDRLEEMGKIEEVHFWTAAPDLEAEMDTVSEMGRSREEKTAFLGTYCALQLLHMNLRAVDLLRLGMSASSERRFKLYRELMLRMGKNLRRLTRFYMVRLLDLFLPDEEERPEFVICGVGTRADQDDLDLGIVDDGTELRCNLNWAIGRLQREMLRWSIPLHLHLSEHVGDKSYSASIDEYVEQIEEGMQNFIVTTELLGARPILGSNNLFNRFTREVTDRYYYQPGGDNRFHEGYLRGMLGEVLSLLLWRLKRDSVDPKGDALRIIKGIITAQRTVVGIKEVNAWDVIYQLRSRDPRRQKEYQALEGALSFVETFRFLYQLLEIQEEEIQLKEAGSRAQLEAVAELMGYQDVGAIRAYDHLLIHYHDQVQAARTAAQVLLNDIQKHLEKASVFSGLLRNRSLDPASSGNLATEFVKELRPFRGTKFWDDVLAPMENSTLLRQFVEDFNSLPARGREIWIQRYAKWGELTSLPLLRFLVILWENRKKAESLSLFHDLSAAFIDRIGKCPDVVQRLTTVFHHYPLLINTFLLGLKDEHKKSFGKIFLEETWSEEVERLRERLLHFCRLHCCSSHYFMRFFQRIVNRYTQYIKHFTQTDHLKVISKGIFAHIESLQNIAQKKEELGSYYDLEFFRVGLECTAGAPSEQTNFEFTEFSDNYLQTLFEVCKQEIDRRLGRKVHTWDLLAIYSAGGHGRKLAFDDDYDLVIFLNSDDEEIRKYCGRIITRMNREIVRRGTMPHYRFAEHFGEYVTTFRNLRDLFAEPDETTFIDMSQLMGARKIVGSKKFERDLQEEIIKPFIFDRKEEYISQLAEEIRSRHLAVDKGVISQLDVKETKGGLRDIELLLLILMARYEIRHPVSADLLEVLCERMPERQETLTQLFDTFTYLKRRRDIYRLTVAAEDEIIPDEAGYLAYVLGYCDDPQDERGASLMVEELMATTGETSDIVESLIDEMKL